MEKVAECRVNECPLPVESRCGAVAVGLVCLLPPLSSGGARVSEGFSHFVSSIAAPVASGWSRCRVGFSPTGKHRLCTAHAKTSHSSGTNPFQASTIGLQII